MPDLADTIESVATETDFSGVVRVDRGRDVLALEAFGFADRAHGVPNTIETVFGIASGAKSFTAMTIMSLVEDGTLSLGSRVREWLGADLSLIDERVTVEHLLSHRSGIGDYLDEEAMGSIDDYVMPVPVHELASTQAYLAALEGHPAVFEPGERFAYCNGGYVVLAIVAERASGIEFPELVESRVCRPADLERTAFIRSDELDGDTAVGYLHSMGLRTNVLHLPVRGSGDGGIFTTVGDVHRLWSAFRSGRIVSEEVVEVMTTPHDGRPDASSNYGLGIWLRPASSALVFEGYDAGVSFRSTTWTDQDTVATVISNTSEGAWTMARSLGALFDPV